MHVPSQGIRKQSSATWLAELWANDVPVEPASSLPLAPVALQSDYPADEFIAGVEEVQERIRAGWVYQDSLSHRFRFDARASTRWRSTSARGP